MKVWKIIPWALAALAGLAVLAGGVLYYKASRVPENYRPPQLNHEEQVAAAKHFVQRVLAEWHNMAQLTVPFTWEIKQKELNAYLASMDEIPALEPDGRRGEVHEKMAKAGLAAPATVVDADKITFMIRSTEYNKVISADISLEFTDDGLLHVRLLETRVGRLTVPAEFVRDRLRQALIRRASKRGADRPPEAGRDRRWSEQMLDGVGRLLEKLILAMDEAPIKPEMVIAKKHRVRIDGIDLEPGLVRVRATPLGRVKRKKSRP